MFNEDAYRNWQEFEMTERRRVGTFQLSVDNLARDLYLELASPENSDDDDDSEVSELNFDV